jgi:hypothetical protein
MALVMPVLAVRAAPRGWFGVLARSQFALLEHGLMMPAMLVPMLIRLDVYTGRAAGAHR